MTTELLNKLKQLHHITNIIDRQKRVYKFKSILKILSRYNAEKIMKYKIKSGEHPSA